MGKVSVVFENITTVTLTAVTLTAVTKIRIQLFNFCGENLNRV